MDFSLDLILRLLIALGLGALIGAEREISKAKSASKKIGFAGLRTFSLVALLGFLGAYLSQMVSPLILVVLMIVVAAFFLVDHLNEFRKLTFFGITSEIAALTTFLMGVITYQTPLFGVILGVVTVLILNLKKRLHDFVEALEPFEFMSAIKFIIVAFVVLPILPKEPIDPWGIISLFNAWLMVVFVSAISFVGYILVKVIGTQKGLNLTAFVGGLASSTATTISLSEQSRRNKKIILPFLSAILVTSTVMFGRAIFEVAVLNRDLLPYMALVLGVMIFTSLMLLLILWVRANKKTKPQELELSSPFRLWPALQFGLLYIFILMATHFGNFYFGQKGIYVASFISGLADIDAITLSLSNLAATGKISTALAGQGIVIAVMTNTVVKLAFVRIFGNPTLFWRVLVSLGLVLLAGIVTLIFF